MSVRSSEARFGWDSILTGDEHWVHLEESAKLCSKGDISAWGPVGTSGTLMFGP